MCIRIATYQIPLEKENIVYENSYIPNTTREGEYCVLE